MSNSLNLIGSLAQDRHAERYHASHNGRQDGARVISETRALESTRTRAGWLLVDLGLRLISSGPARSRAAAQRARLIGQ